MAIVPDAVRRALPVLGYRSGARLARVLPLPAGDAVAAGAALAMARLPSGRRDMVRRHLRRVLGPSVSERELDRRVRRGFDSYARYWLESFRLPDESRQTLDAGMSYEGLGHLERGMAAGKGVIAALPHLGNWDFGGAWLAVTGFPLTVVVEPLEPPELFDWFAEFRRSLGMTIVPLGPEAGPAVLRTLREGRLLALLSDRDVAGNGVEVDFFGERTTLPSGPATLALRTGAALLPMAVYFEGRHHHHGVVRPPLPVERQASLREDVARITQLLANELETLIRRAPDQWHLFQPNWPSDRA